MGLRDDITHAVGEAQIEGFSFVRLTKWEGLLHRVAERFLQRGVRDLESVWMWNEFRQVVSTSQPADPLGYLQEQVELASVYWFIASDQHGKYWVAEATGSAIVRVVSEMYGFEYYVVERHLDWIFCENHHGIFIKAQPGKNPNGEQAFHGDGISASSLNPVSGATVPPLKSFS
jgi:hypothetical protein